MKEIVQKLCEHGLPAGEVPNICAKVHENTYREDVKNSVRKAALAVAELGQASDFANGNIFLRGVALECLEKRSAEAGAKEAILAAAGDSSKHIREQAARILPKHPE